MEIIAMYYVTKTYVEIKHMATIKQKLEEAMVVNWCKALTFTGSGIIYDGRLWYIR